MSDGTAPRHRGRDLDTPGEVAEFVARFYREIAQHARFHHYFDTIAHVDWDAHTRDLTDFWVGVLLTEPDREPGVVLEAHRWLHAASAFDPTLFADWLEIFDATLDGGWQGPTVERARRRAHGYAWAMAKRVADIDIGARRLVGR